jgi:arylsulfatase A-like enzyme
MPVLDSRPDTSAKPSAFRVTSPGLIRHGAVAGALLGVTYAALELLCDGPFTMEATQSIPAWYTGAIAIYSLLYAVSGGLVGAFAGLLLSRIGCRCHHVMPTLSALLMLVFVGNALAFGMRLGSAPFLALLLPVALWLLTGLLFDDEDPARAFVGSPWPAAILTLVPVFVSRGEVVRLGQPGNTIAAACIAVLVLGLPRFTRSRPRLRAFTPPGVQPVLTALVLAACFGMLWFLRPVTVQAAAQPAAASHSPDIVLITLDTTRVDHLSVYGYPRPTTPRLRKFASGATIYRHAYANGDMTLSAHGAIFTGLYPTQNGAHVERSERMAVSAQIPTLGELLSKAGYRTYASVANKIFLDPVWGFARGFDRWEWPNPLPVVPINTRQYLLRRGLYKVTLPWMWTGALRQFAPASEIASIGERLVDDSGGKPFLLFLNFMEDHRPWVPPAESRLPFADYEQTFDELALRGFQPSVMKGLRSVTPEERSKIAAAYDASVASLDTVVGGLLERFAQEPWWNRSLVIVTADHGEHLGEKNLLDHANGVDAGVTSIPLIVKFPDQTDGRVVTSPVSQVDIFTTIAGAAGVPLPGPRPGWDLATGNPNEERPIIMESFPTRAFMANPKMDRTERGIVRGRWKLIASTNGRRELYDMNDDPTESHELSGRHADVAADLEAALKAWTVDAERSRPRKNAWKPDETLLQRLRALGYVQ